MIRWSNLPRLTKVYLNVRQEMELRRRKQKKKQLIDHDSGDGGGVSGGAPPQNNGPPETVLYSAPPDQYHLPHQHLIQWLTVLHVTICTNLILLFVFVYDGFGWFFVWKNARKFLKRKIVMLHKRVNNLSSSSISYLPRTFLQISQIFKDSSL